MGGISTDWEQLADERFTLNVTIPANAAARIHLPARRNSRIFEGGKKVSDRSDTPILSWLDNEVVIAVGAGTYRFVVATQD
jgi:alpha-L-rhamnosidase